MKILAIETSCDETAAAVVEDGRKILSDVVASSKDMHAKTGGVIPEMAAREQVKCIIQVINEALAGLIEVGSGKWEVGKRSGKLDDLKSHFSHHYQTSHLSLLTAKIDAIAVAVGPGLIGSLLVGVETAKTIAFVTKKPIIPVNHIFAHIYANWLDTEAEPQFPAIALVVSGGHTELFLVEDHPTLRWLGGTLDDAAGEAFDKTARLLGLGGYPGGPAISAAAEKFQITNSKLQINKIVLPRPMIGSKDLNFSFSGLKTAVLREVVRLKAIQQFNNVAIQQLAYEIQESITDVLVKKTLDAVKKYHVKSILLGGGVAANRRLTEKLQTSAQHLAPASPAGGSSVQLFIPPPKLCTDNAAYIASYADFHYTPVPWQKIQAQPDLDVEVS